MAWHSSAARTNLTSRDVSLDRSELLGEGAFRLAYAGTFIGGNRNGQEAVCKCFKRQYWSMENEFYQKDAEVTNRAIEYAEGWNLFCDSDEKILITQGEKMEIDGRYYLVEPLIRYFTKYTSNNGWIAREADEGWAVLAMEAFSHYTYHRSGGSLIVCDLQGRHRNNPYNVHKSRFELTDPAICSRRRNFGPTDLGEKGIESFLPIIVAINTVKMTGRDPGLKKKWFARSSKTSMLGSSYAPMLTTSNQACFNASLEPFYENDSDDSDDSEYDSY